MPKAKTSNIGRRTRNTRHQRIRRGKETKMALRAIQPEPEDARSVHQICRLCMGEECLENVFAEEGLHQWISDYLSITISAEDNMGQLICSMCRIRLTEFHQFRVHSQEVQDILQSMIQPFVSDVEMSKDSEIESQLQQYSEYHQSVLNPDYIKSITTDNTREVKGIVVKLEPGLLESPSQIQEQDQYTENNTGILYESEECDQQLGIEDMIVVENVKIEDCKEDMETVNGETEDGEHSNDMEGEQSNITEKVQANTRTTDLQCDICVKTFPDRRKFIAHGRRHSKNYSCSVCAKPFGDRWSMQRHMRSHLTVDERNREPRRFQCDICEKFFLRSDILGSHKKLVHGRISHDCQKCGLQFSTRGSLAKHLCVSNLPGEKKESHRKKPNATLTAPEEDVGAKESNGEEDSKKAQSDEKSVACTDCPQIFRTKSDSWSHYKREHLKRVKCSLCNAAFATTKLLKNHTLNVHKEDEARNQSDEVGVDNRTSDTASPQGNEIEEVDVDNRTSDKKALQGKRRKKDIFKCPICERPFARRWQVDNHVRVHLSIEERQREERPFKCEICQQTFRLKCKLNYHKSYVHGPKKYECEICGFRATRRNNLDRHKMLHANHQGLPDSATGGAETSIDHDDLSL